MARIIEFDEELAIGKAMNVFWKKGYSATSMRDLTEAMQINSSSLYNTIGDKHSLFVRSIKHYTNLRKKEAMRRQIDFASPFKALEAFINDAVKTITEEPNSCLCLKAAFEIQDGDPDVEAVINDYDSFVHNFLKDLIKKAQAKNEISNEENPDTIADYLNAIFTGWYNYYILHKDRKKIRNMAALVIRQLKS